MYTMNVETHRRKAPAATSEANPATPHPLRELQLRQEVADKLEQLVIERTELPANRRQELRRAFPQYLRAPRDTTAELKRHQRRQWGHVLWNKHALLPLSCTLSYWGLRTWAQVLVSRQSNVRLITGIPVATLRNSGYLYVALWIASELTNLLGQSMRPTWQHKAFKGYLHETERSNENRLENWVNEDRRHALTDAVSSGGLQAFGNAANFVDKTVYTAGAVVNLALTAGTVLGLFDYAVLGATLLGVCTGFLLLNQMFLNEAASKESACQARYRTHLATFPDNVQIANPYNLTKWKKDNMALEQAYHQALWRREGTQLLGQGFGNALVGLPMMLMVIYKLMGPDADQNQIAQAMLTLGNLVKVSVVAKGLVEATAGCSSVAGKFHKITKASHADTADDWNNRLLNMLDKRDQLRISYQKGKTAVGEVGKQVEVAADTLLADVPKFLSQPGRWMICAANGIGKTTMGSALMSQLPGKYDYIPVKHRLHFDYQDGSAGQKTLKQLAELIRHSSRRVVFLDEWPANLDPLNNRKVNALLDHLAEELTLVEMIPAV